MKRGFERLGSIFQEGRKLIPPPVSRIVIVIFWLSGILLLGLAMFWLVRGLEIPVFQTRGEIAHRQRNLLVFAIALAGLVLVPVYVMLFAFAWRYRAGHSREYRPEWDSDKRYEAVWWGIPIAIISVLAVVTWVTSHSLDPYKPLASSQAPLKVQVIALQWKWLFIYPEQRVASVGEVAFPVGRPVEFTITSDAPMNSFWIPQLAGQVYAMSGMSTKLNISADQAGDYRGMSSNLSGKGFADMTFTAKAMDTKEFTRWLQSTRSAKQTLDPTSYAKLARPRVSAIQYYGAVDPIVYENAIMKYMSGSMISHGTEHTEENSPSPVKSPHSDHIMHDMESQ
ncbi:ubiquinol oxidase subunit II [Candidatus Saccharibacteria bacterium]|nr:ubiquinol oxidase subunit II [Candidatus Saccharibacteria bacterium]